MLMRGMKFTYLLTLVFFAVPTVAFAKTYTVSPGMSIQSFIDKAASGDTVQVLPGEYIESITISKPNLHVVGMEYEGAHTLLYGFNKEDAEQLSNPIVIEADDVVVEGFHVRGFEGAGLLLKNRARVTLKNLDISVSGGDAIRFEDSTEVTIEGCVVRSGGHVGISLRGCQGVTVTRCEVYRNALGVEILDGLETRLDGLSVHTNGMGILLANTKGAAGNAEHTTIGNSRILNNRTAMGEGADIESPLFMAGVGIRIVGAVHTQVARCYIEGNDTYGIITEQFAGGAKPYPAEHTYVHHNEYSDNGNAPSAEYTKAYPDIAPGDLYWDSKGRRNQWQEAGELKVYPEKLITQFGGLHTGGMHFL